MTRAIAGVSDHGGWAVLVTASRDGAVILVERVRASADRRAAEALAALAAAIAS